MAYRWLADATVALHLSFILFVLGGGFLARRNPRWAWAHLPAVAWVVYLEFTGALCPLTPLENMLRAKAGDAGYAGGFVDHYLLPVIYPDGLTARVQVALGIAVVALNVLVYRRVWHRRRAARSR
jgi:hypothetical protein